jgi:hypothetical protein
VIVIEIVPGELLDCCLQADVVDWPVGVLRRQLYFAEGWQRDLFIGSVPGLYLLDLAAIAGAVEIDDDMVNAEIGEGGEYQVFVLRAGVFGGCAGLIFDRVGHGCLPAS